MQDFYKTDVFNERFFVYRLEQKHRRMGSRRSGAGGSRGNAGVMKERANLSFMLVVMFFGVFAVIVLTEIFLIDERRGMGVGGSGALGGHRSGHRLPAAPDRPDYGEIGVSTQLQPSVPGLD